MKVMRNRLCLGAPLPPLPPAFPDEESSLPTSPSSYYSSHSRSTGDLPDFIDARCRKVDVSLRLTELGCSDNIVYPRHVKNLERYGGSDESYVCCTLPSIDEIKATMERARIDAKAVLMKLGVDVADPDDQLLICDSRLTSKPNEPLENPAPTDDDVNEIDECEEV
ncbi:hypothetical protein OUZ56_007388 [Daphnia magna]|uniref:Uncharacterized protein n=1 Tax=Daphnia magna TaxID=35525 RepID=A0ABR0AA00_9CRUS|nr:hypothetical protein OUZ56_007388 [Daphnia magna]